MKQNEQARSSSRLFIPPQKPESGTTNMQSFFSTKTNKETENESTKESGTSREEAARQLSRFQFNKELMDTEVLQNYVTGFVPLEATHPIHTSEENVAEIDEVDPISEIEEEIKEEKEYKKRRKNELRGKSIHAMTKEEKIEYLLNKPKYIPNIPCLFLTENETVVGFIKEQVNDSIVIDLLTNFDKVHLNVKDILEIHPYVTKNK